IVKSVAPTQGEKTCDIVIQGVNFKNASATIDDILATKQGDDKDDGTLQVEVARTSAWNDVLVVVTNEDGQRSEWASPKVELRLGKDKAIGANAKLAARATPGSGGTIASVQFQRRDANDKWALLGSLITTPDGGSYQMDLPADIKDGPLLVNAV